jgi:hypothetical protein
MNYNTNWKREWEGSDLFGYDVIDIKINFGRKVAHWRLYINREVKNNEVNKVSIVGR